MLDDHRRVLKEPLFAAAIRRFPIPTGQCRKGTVPYMKIRENSVETAPQGPVRRVKKVSAQKDRFMLSDGSQKAIQPFKMPDKTKSPLSSTPMSESEAIDLLIKLKHEEVKGPVHNTTDLTVDRLPTHVELNIVAPIPRLPPIVEHQIIDDELKHSYDVPPISSPFVTEAPCGWIKGFSQQVREAMDELRGTALESILKKWTDDMIKGQRLPSFEIAGEYLGSIVESVTLGPEGESFLQSRISKVFEDQIEWLSPFHTFKQLEQSQSRDQKRRTRL